MRPIRLELQAFGSYGGRLEVDFARLGRHGIFAITGPTGAGKSTIFDALVYALYGDLPGFREDGSVRSQFASPATETWVRLELEVHGERWRVERRPAQPAARRRGSGDPVDKPSSVVLAHVGDDGDAVPGSALNRKAAVTRRLDELVGLSKEQFEQVVLIPQGKFEEVLKADTAKRAPLLRRLFPVEIYGRVTEALREVAASRSGDYEHAVRVSEGVVDRLCEVVTAIAELIAPYAGVGADPDAGSGSGAGAVADVEVGAGGESGTAVDTHAPTWSSSRLDQVGARMAARLAGGFAADDLRAYLDDVTALRSALDSLVASAASREDTVRSTLDAAREALARWRQWQEDLVSAASFSAEEAADATERMVLERSRRLVDLRAAVDGWTDASLRKADLAPLLAQKRRAVKTAWVDGHGEEALETSSAAGLLAQRLASDAENLGAETERFEKLRALSEELQVRADAVRSRREKLPDRRSSLDAEGTAVDELSEQVSRLETVAAGLDRCASSLEEVQLEQDIAHRRAELEEESATLADKTAAANEVADGTRAVLAAVQAAWRDGLAGRLAQALVEGGPCPTCGSLEHPSPAVLLEDAPDDDALADAERSREEAERALRELERRTDALAGELRALPPSRDEATLGAELTRRRGELEAAREAARGLGALIVERDDRAAQLARGRVDAEREAREIDVEAAGLDVASRVHAEEQRAFVERHDSFVSPAPRARALAELAKHVEELARLLANAEDAEATKSRYAEVLEPVLAEIGADDPSVVAELTLEPEDIQARGAALEARRARRADVRRRLDEHEQRGGPLREPELRPLEMALEEAERSRLTLVERRALVAEKATVLLDGPEALKASAREVESSRLALERARTVANLCAGLGGGPDASVDGDGASGGARQRIAAATRLSLENWVLADYLREVLVHANVRLATMTEGRFALQLSEGVTDGRKSWGLDISVFDAHTGQVRPATTMSGGETFMAALSLALGLADVVSAGSNREIGALFVDEGFGSLDPQALEAVVDVLRSLEDGGRVVGVISHVDEVKEALPTGISVAPSVRGSVARVHYPDD